MTISTLRSLARARLASSLFAAFTLAVVAVACVGGSEGDRCNPLLSHDECGGQALVCSGPGTAYPLPGTCVENYCCPKDPTRSSFADCNGTDTACPAADAGGTASNEAGDAAPE